MKVNKTIKLFMGGKFPRTESGRSYKEYYAKASGDGERKVYAELCQASRKDLRNSVEAAKAGASAWGKANDFLKSQILYRMAEMAEGKRTEFAQLFQDVLGLSEKEAQAQVDNGIDAFVYYAGFADKYQQVIGAVNPVPSPHHNFTTPAPMGVVMLVAQDKFDFGKLVGDICGILCGGNSAIVLLGKECPSILAPLAEVFATSDLPAGAVNLLTGHLEELKSWIGSHMEIQAISFQNEDESALHEMKEEGVENMKRISPPLKATNSIESILSFVEHKTVWHPIGI